MLVNVDIGEAGVRVPHRWAGSGEFLGNVNFQLPLALWFRIVWISNLVQYGRGWAGIYIQSKAAAKLPPVANLQQSSQRFVDLVAVKNLVEAIATAHNYAAHRRVVVHGMGNNHFIGWDTRERYPL